MSYQVLYRTYRPKRFEEVVGQEYIIKILKNCIKNKKIAHAYLFAGPRGTGKTTIAKIFAKAINCEHFEEEACDNCPSCLAFNDNNNPDIIELDAASNNSVENIRELIDEVSFAPMIGKYKVYIIDEVHMLTTSAFNAFLKTLEEPPAHVVFILATTDPQKIIPTVLSRCQRYNFSKISKSNMKKKMIEILNKENLQYEEKALEEVATLAEGGMRDALSILEQVLSYNDQGIFLEDVQKIFGLSTNEEKVELLIKTHNDLTGSINLLRQMYDFGIDPKRLCIDLLEIIKESLIYSDDQNDSLLNKLSKFDAMNVLEAIEVDDLLADITYLEDALNKGKSNQSFLTYLELALIKMGGNVSNKNKVTPIKPIIEEKPEVKEKEPVVEAIKEETVKEATIEKQEVANDVSIENKEDDIDIEYLAGLLVTANKDEKISDKIIYNRLEMYRTDVKKRKFYQLLKNTDLFASGKDAIIVIGPKLYIDDINATDNRNELYRFLTEEFGLDKVIYGIEDKKRDELISVYRRLMKDKTYRPPFVQKPIIEKEITNEDKAKQLFDNVRIED